MIDSDIRATACRLGQRVSTGGWLLLDHAKYVCKAHLFVIM